MHCYCVIAGPTEKGSKLIKITMWFITLVWQWTKVIPEEGIIFPKLFGSCTWYLSLVYNDFRGHTYTHTHAQTDPMKSMPNVNCVCRMFFFALMRYLSMRHLDCRMGNHHWPADLMYTLYVIKFTQCVPHWIYNLFFFSACYKPDRQWTRRRYFLLILLSFDTMQCWFSSFLFALYPCE